MSQRYGTRSTTKAARSRAFAAGNPRAYEQSSSSIAAVPLAGNGEAEAAEAPRPPRKPLTPPSSFHSAVDGGRPQRQEPPPATLVLPAKRALVHNSAAPPSASASAAPASAVLVPPTARAARVGAENHPPSGAGGGPRKRSRLSLGLSKRRVSPPEQAVAAPAALAPIGHGSKIISSGAVVGCFPGGISPRLSEGCVGSAKRPLHMSPPPPPFVGLKNVGETCYVSAVLQSLAACHTALKSGRGASGVAGDEDKAGDTQGEDDGLGPSSAARAYASDGVELCSVNPVSTGVRAGGADGNPVFLALGKVLGEMEGRNRALFQLQRRQQQQQQFPEPPVELSTDPQESVLAGDGTPDMPVRPSDQTPRRPGVPTREDACAGAIAPHALVELLRDGWLTEGRPTGGATAGFLRQLGGGASAGAGDFGSGQACVSELLGKLLDVCAATAAAGVTQDRGGDVSSGSVGERRGGDSGGVRGLATAFRGTLCARTHCVECERDRTSREEFTELTLPPLVLPPPPPPQPPAQPLSPNSPAARGAAAAAAAENSGDGDLSESPREMQTLQCLVDAMLGRESLEGDNKVWCEACRQWNEAERRSSLCSPPGLLALHVRPGPRKKSSPCPFPAAAIVAAGGASRKLADGAVGGADGRGRPHKAEQGQTAHNESGELIERVLVVKRAARCQSHAAEASGSGRASSVPARKAQLLREGAEGGKGHRVEGGKQHRPPPSDSGDVFYDLVGVILHQGQTLGSGHYTFALHAGGTSSRFGDQPPAHHHHHHHPPSAGDRSSASGGTEHSGSSAGVTDRKGPDSAVLQQGSVGEGEAGGAVAGGASCAEPAFALFDDDVVRWLSLEEEFAVLRGGVGAIGDPFLVFYARRD